MQKCLQRQVRASILVEVCRYCRGDADRSQVIHVRLERAVAFAEQVGKAFPTTARSVFPSPSKSAAVSTWGFESRKIHMWLESSVSVPTKQKRVCGVLASVRSSLPSPLKSAAKIPTEPHPFRSPRRPGKSRLVPKEDRNRARAGANHGQVQTSRLHEISKQSPCTLMRGKRSTRAESSVAVSQQNVTTETHDDQVELAVPVQVSRQHLARIVRNRKGQPRLESSVSISQEICMLFSSEPTNAATSSLPSPLKSPVAIDRPPPGALSKMVLERCRHRFQARLRQFPILHRSQVQFPSPLKSRLPPELADHLCSTSSIEPNAPLPSPNNISPR